MPIEAVYDNYLKVHDNSLFILLVSVFLFYFTFLGLVKQISRNSKSKKFT